MKYLLIFLSLLFGLDSIGQALTTPKQTFAYSVDMRLDARVKEDLQVRGGAVIGDTTLNGNASLELVGTTKGLLPNRLTTAQQNAIVSPANGLTIYNTDSNALCRYDAADGWRKYAVGDAGSNGTVTSVSVVTANGLAGTVATATTTPAITLTTSVTGVLKGNGTAISAAVSGTDYAPATSGTAILKGNGSGGFSAAVAETDYVTPTGSGSLTNKTINGANNTLTVRLANDVTGDLPFANLTAASAASKLLGRGSASGAGDYEEITLGSGLTMTNTTLSASGSGADTSLTWLKAGNGGTTAGTDFIGTTDSVDFVTKTNGTERMRVKANGYGNYGGDGQDIGGITTSPPFFNYKKNINGFAKLQIENQTDGNDAVSALMIAGVPNVARGVIPENSHYGYIGVFSPIYTDTIYQHTLSMVSGGGLSRGMQFYADGGVIRIRTTSNVSGLGNDLCVAAASDSTGTITAANRGFVGVGTADPKRPLTVYNTSPAIAFQTATTGTTSSDGCMILGGGGMQIWNFENFEMTFGTNNVERMRIKADGTGVGINTAAPIRDLQVHNLSASGGIAITNTTTGATAGNGFQLIADGNDGYIIQNENAPVYYTTNATLRWTMAANGTWTAADAINMAFGTGTGTKIGTATTQKIGFWNAAPVAQYATTGTVTGFTAGGGTTATDASTYTGDQGSTAYTTGDIVRALKLAGIIAQ